MDKKIARLYARMVKKLAGRWHDGVLWPIHMKENKWVRPLAYITGLVNQELLLQNEYLAAENRILRDHLPSRLRWSDPQRSTLAEIGRRLGSQGSGPSGLHRQAGHGPGLVPETHRPEVRWIQTPELSWQAGCRG